ncbi:MAG TPA: hypothetical protein VKT80_12600 [Chloroflexota bacterium]|nr:hypothetical protein [Chloroflexota bacterium]
MVDEPGAVEVSGDQLKGTVKVVKVGCPIGRKKIGGHAEAELNPRHRDVRSLLSVSRGSLSDLTVRLNNVHAGVSPNLDVVGEDPSLG